MRIALRTGGGRGVYELAGRQGDLIASNLFGHEIFYELTPEIIVPGRSAADQRQGKPRIALDSGTRSTTTHLYRLLSAVLLLPKPKREFKTTHGTELIKYESYSMTAIKVDVAGMTPETVVLRPTDILLENADNLHSEVGFTARMSRILRLWDAAANQNSQIAKQVQKLESVVRAKDPDYKEIERCAQIISDELKTDGDPLLLVEEELGISPASQEGAQIVSPTTSVHKASFGLEDDVSPQEALVRRVKVWRQQADRGFAGRKFSKDVSNAYDYRCIFSGQRLPRLEVTDSAGVDSAHILPWSTHDLNSVRNGICLNKQCHWAFDQGILRLNFDSSCNTYVVSIPSNIKSAASNAQFDLAYFESVTGPIPQTRLPKEQSQWPSPTYLAELNHHMTAI